MQRLLFAFACAFAFSAFAPAVGAAAVDPAEWDAAVAALHDVDPTISPPANDPATVNAVGGGSVTATDLPNFGFGATIGPGGLNGQMTVVDATGQTSSATVVCLAVAPLPGGGAIATLVGEIKAGSTAMFPTLLFTVTDSGRPGGDGDTWSGVTLPTPAAMVPCEPEVSTQPITGSIVINVP